MADDRLDVGDPAFSRGLVDRDEDVPCDADLVERRDVAVQDGSRSGRERVVLVPVEIRGEDRRQQEQSEHDPRVSRGDRPAAVDGLPRAARQRALRESGQRKSQPGADCDLRQDRPHDAGVRQPRESRETARDQDRAGSRPGPGRPDPTCDPRRRDRRQRHDRHDEPRRERLEPPAVDQQDHEEEERGHEGARDEEERRVRCDLRPLDRLGHAPRLHAGQCEQAE